MAKNYYETLGVPKTATKEEIKKAFHKLAHKHHPDKKGGDEAKFKEANEAYQILSDDTKRAQYDQFGTTGNMGGGGGGQPGWGDFDFSGFQGQGGAGGQGFEFDLGDIFGQFFGGNARGEQTPRGRDISVDIQIPFADSIFGTTRTILINKVGKCENCNGSGAAPESAGKTKTCPTCNGKGKIQETRRSVFGSFVSERACETCHGSGKVPEKPCPQCDGLGVKKKQEEINVKIPAGIEVGEMIRMSGQGEAVPGGVAGDLYIKVHIERDPLFTREGENLNTTLNIKLTDALLGATEKIKTLDGELEVKIPEGISSGEILRVKGRGVPQGGNKRGDLLIKIIIKTPTRLSRSAKKLIEDLKGEGL